MENMHTEGAKEATWMVDSSTENVGEQKRALN